MASLFIHLSLSLSLEIFIEYYVLHTGKHTVNKNIENYLASWNLHSREGETDTLKYKQVQHVSYELVISSLKNNKADKGNNEFGGR